MKKNFEKSIPKAREGEESFHLWGWGGGGEALKSRFFFFFAFSHMTGV